MLTGSGKRKAGVAGRSVEVEDGFDGTVFLFFAPDADSPLLGELCNQFHPFIHLLWYKLYCN